MRAQREHDARALAMLEQVAARGARVLRGERRRRALGALFVTLIERLWIAGAGTALLLVGGPATVAGWIALGVGAAAAVLALVNTVSAAQHVDDADALARLDRELGLADRLLTARDFLLRACPTGFMRAAVADARDAVERARAAELRPVAVPARMTRAGRFSLLATVALLVAGATLPPAVAGPGAGAGALPPRHTARALETVAPQLRDERRTADATAPRPESVKENASRPDAAPETPEEGESGAIPDDARETKGATGEGRSAEASASRGAGQSKGVPSDQGQVSVPEARTPRRRKRKKESAEPDAAPAPRKKPGAEERSGATAGSGAASGSNRNPSTSEWSSKDQVSETDDDPVEDDSDVDDEDSGSEARGGLQPNLRDRRAPVNRDLSVGFGNQPDEEANGRGGPGRAKKSRGTASLVLGVPIPDHVKGQPNAGRTKITQERVEPKDDDVEPVPATGRGARGGPTGHVGKPVLAPWMRALVRAYFLRAHQQERSRP